MLDIWEHTHDGLGDEEGGGREGERGGRERRKVERGKGGRWEREREREGRARQREGRKRERRREREKERESQYGPDDGYNRLIATHANRQKDRQTDTPTRERQTDRQTDRLKKLTNRPTEE